MDPLAALLAALCATLGIEPDGVRWLAIALTDDDNGARMEVQVQRSVRVESPAGAVAHIVGAVQAFDVTLALRPSPFVQTERARRNEEEGKA